MKSTALRSLAVLAASSAPAFGAGLKTIANPARKENYANGDVMDNIMSAKYVSKKKKTYHILKRDGFANPAP